MSWNEIVFWAWFGGYLAFVIPSARWLLRTVVGGDLQVDKADLMFATFLGFVVALGWPLFAPGAYVYSRLQAEVERRKTP